MTTPSSTQSLLINIDELWLKGKNRKMYTTILKRHLNTSMKLYHKENFILTQEGPKFFITSSTDIHPSTVNALAKIAGIRSLQICRTIKSSENYENDIAALKDLAWDEFNRTTKNKPIKTFAVRSKRSNKEFPLNSTDLSRQVGATILFKSNDSSGKSPFKVNLTTPDITIEIYILHKNIFISTERIEGIGGLPVSTSGKMLTLISGGFDSPVASYMMFRRGVSQDFVFFHATPYIGNEVKEKVISIVEKLAIYQPSSKLYIVPFGSTQKTISEKCRVEYRTLLFRKAMVMAAEYLAKRVRASALINGDALAQVSSQTLTNINIIDQATQFSIFRPLIGFNKEEILELSRKINIHDISVIPHDDACALFAPKHPIIHGSIEYSNNFSKECDLTDELMNSIRAAEVITFSQKGIIKNSTDRQKKDRLQDSLFDF